MKVHPPVLPTMNTNTSIIYINYSFAPSHFPAFDKYKKLGRTCGPSVLKKGRVLGYGSIPKTESLIRLSMIWML